MRGGQFRHVITLQQATTTRDPDTLEELLSWQDWQANVPAEVKPLSGREFIQSAAGQSEVSARITIRWLPGVEPTMRVLFDGGTYDIAAVLPDPTARRHITLMVSKGLGDGR